MTLPQLSTPQETALENLSTLLTFEVNGRNVYVANAFFSLKKNISLTAGAFVTPNQYLSAHHYIVFVS